MTLLNWGGITYPLCYVVSGSCVSNLWFIFQAKFNGYGSLTVAELVIIFVDTIVRLKGSGAPGLQSCFEGPFTGTLTQTFCKRIFAKHCKLESVFESQRFTNFTQTGNISTNLETSK